ncbi:aldose epimerase family protein [Planctomicrobium sp. SH661]|uniref:aldose epimerase family protein n=1 Tax=Planctomicrobium sp. SH661 TaxID=3448124 RepID=UPI003F5BC90E
MSVQETVWGRTETGEDLRLFTLQNDSIVMKVSDLGATLVSLSVPDRDGKLGNVVVGGESFETYRTNSSYLGATVGRFANRIGQGRFELLGKPYELATNLGPNHLHGGLRGLTYRQWEAQAGDDAVTFTTFSPDGEDGYPGNLQVSMTYRLTGSTLTLEYAATCDATTIVNLTNHAYWNLVTQGPVLDHELQLNADQFLEVDENMLPTGKIVDVAGTPFDFRSSHPIGQDLSKTNGGYDNCLVVRDWDKSLRLAATVKDPSSGRIMEVLTTEPGVQLYTANHFDGSISTGGARQFEAFCLECQYFPDSPNQPSFPSTILQPGETYRQVTQHRFSV